MQKMIEEMQAEAQALLSAGEYTHALAEFSVLREIRARREGPYSPRYLSNLHDCIRCTSQLEMWSDCTPLCSELHGKYVRTHGLGEADTVDVAKHWAWALVHLHDYPPALRLYLTTADALWDIDPAQAVRLLGAAAVYQAAYDPPSLIDDVKLRHSTDVLTSLNQMIAALPASDAAITRDGLAIA